MAGMMAMSAAPVRKASAHSEGTVNDKSYLPQSGPSVNPQTRGAVFRYCTMEMRSFVTLHVFVASFGPFASFAEDRVLRVFFQTDGRKPMTRKIKYSRQ